MDGEIEAKIRSMWGQHSSLIIKTVWPDADTDMFYQKWEDLDIAEPFPVFPGTEEALYQLSRRFLLSILTNRNIRTAIDRYFRIAGIDGAKVNDLRHTFIAHHLMAGTPITTLSKLVGHKRLSTTEKYLELVKDKQTENVKLEEL